MGLRRVQIITMAISGFSFPVFVAAGGLIWRSTFAAACFFGMLYVVVLAALLSTLGRYRAVQKSSLPPWRRAPYITGLLALLALCLLPPATWLIGFGGFALHARSAVICLFALNVAAAVLVWFGNGWSRLGLTIVAYWVLFLWVFPLGIRG